MKKGKFTEHQIVSALKKQEAGIAVKDISRELGISEATFYWILRSKFTTISAQSLPPLGGCCS